VPNTFIEQTLTNKLFLL
jgi:hypothetical protein